MAGDKGRAALKLACEPEIVHVGSSAGFGVIMSRSESEQTPSQNKNLKGKWRTPYPTLDRKQNPPAQGKPELRRFILLLKVSGAISHGQAGWRERVHMPGPLGHEVPALLQSVGRQI